MSPFGSEPNADNNRQRGQADGQGKVFIQVNEPVQYPTQPAHHRYRNGQRDGDMGVEDGLVVGFSEVWAKAMELTISKLLRTAFMILLNRVG